MGMLWRYHANREQKPAVVPLEETRLTADELAEKALAEAKAAEELANKVAEELSHK